jgi:hypothetical protein
MESVAQGSFQGGDDVQFLAESSEAFPIDLGIQQVEEVTKVLRCSDIIQIYS